MGLAIDLFLTTPLGLSALSFAITGYAVGVFQAGHGAHDPVRWPRCSAGSAGFFGGLVFLTVGAVVGQTGFLSFDEPEDRDRSPRSTTP